MSGSEDDPGRRTPAVPSGLGFGCAELFRLPSARARRRVLDAALDAGIAHFDVAPMYGLGRAETEVGAFLRGRRDRAVLATKFGIDVTRVARLGAAVQGPIRRVLRAWPAMHGAARTRGAGPASGPVGALLYDAVGYDARAARAGLERSLRSLRTDRLDLYLLHDPAPLQLADEVADHLEQMRAEGLIGTWGVAGEVADAMAASQRLRPAPRVLQIRDDVFGPAPDGPPRSGAQRITFGALGRAIGRIVAHTGADDGERRLWSQAIGHDAGDPQVIAALLLRDARRRNPTGVTLFSTTRPERIGPTVAACGAPDGGDVDAFIALIADRMGGPGPARVRT